MNAESYTLSKLIEQHGGLIQTGPFGSQLHQHEYVDSGVPVVMPKDIAGGRVSDADIAMISENKANTLARHKLKKGDIVFPRRGDIRKCALIGEDQEGYLCGTGCLKITVPDQVYSPHFLYYYLVLPKVGEWLERNAVGTTMLNLNTSILGGVSIPDKSIDEQKKIVSILFAYDDLIENNRHRIQLLEESARLLYKEWFVRLRFPGHEHVKVVDGVPEGWEVRPIKEVVEGVFDGPHATPPAADDGPIFLGIKNITEAGRLDLTAKRFISEADFPKWTKRVTPQPGDIVFSYEATLNLYALIPEGFRGCLGRRLALVRPIAEDRTGLFIYYSFFSSRWRSVIEQNRLCGATVDRVPIAKFPEFELLMPSERLLEAFHEHVLPLKKQMETLEKQNIELTKARDILLPRLMNGEVAV